MLTWGLLVIIVNVVYLLLSMLIGYLAYKFFKHKYKHIGKIVFIVVLFAPFWDLIIQKGVKTYYQAFKMEAKIYAYPELDENGKIESLDFIESTKKQTITSFINHLNLNRKERTFQNVNIDEFSIDYFRKYDFDNRIKKVRIRFDDIKPQFEYIQIGTARYKVVTNSKKYLFDLYTVNEYLLIDNKTDETLAKDMSVGFKKGSKSKFRNKLLLWKSANNSAFRVGSIRKNGIIKQVLKLKRI